MITYCTKRESTNRSKFLYVNIGEAYDHDIVEQLSKEMHLTNHIESLHEDNAELHITCNGAFEEYLQKRLHTPKVVFIANTIKEAEVIVERFGYVLAR